MKLEPYKIADYKTKTAMWQHLEPAIQTMNNQAEPPARLAPTMGDVTKKHMEDECMRRSKNRPRSAALAA